MLAYIYNCYKCGKSWQLQLTPKCPICFEEQEIFQPLDLPGITFRKLMEIDSQLYRYVRDLLIITPLNSKEMKFSSIYFDRNGKQTVSCYPDKEMTLSAAIGMGWSGRAERMFCCVSQEETIRGIVELLLLEMGK